MNNPFLLAAIFAVLVALGLVVRYLIARWTLTTHAREEYASRQVDRAATIASVSEADFVRIYVDGYGPRWALYAAATLIAAILVTPFATVGLLSLWDVITSSLGASDVFAPGYYPWMFYMFFSLVGVWAFCGFIAARFHHQRAPEPFQAALMRARGEALDDVEIKRARPKWARRAAKIAARIKDEEAKN